MLIKFATRFAALLVGILVLIALAVHFIFTQTPSIQSWIVLFPIILAVPIFTSIFIARDDELGLKLN